MSRSDFQRVCNEALARLVCPKHGTSPDPDQLMWRWFVIRAGSASAMAPYWFVPRNNICGGTAYGACPTLTNLMQEEVVELYQDLSPLHDSDS
jgi:hypothetical protein